MSNEGIKKIVEKSENERRHIDLVAATLASGIMAGYCQGMDGVPASSFIEEALNSCLKVAKNVCGSK